MDLICFGKHGDGLICQVSLAHITEGGWFNRSHRRGSQKHLQILALTSSR